MKTILVVDDERDLLTAVSGVLEDEGYEVIECSNGKEALEYLSTNHPDAALIDVMMPILGGNDLVEILRRNPTFDGMPIVMMSAVERIQVDGKRISAFLKKPFQLKRLLATIRDVTG